MRYTGRQQDQKRNAETRSIGFKPTRRQIEKERKCVNRCVGPSTSPVETLYDVTDLQNIIKLERKEKGENIMPEKR